MTTILSKIRKPQAGETSLQSVLEVTQQQIMAEARNKIQPELDRARSQAAAAQSRAEAAEVESRNAAARAREMEALLAEVKSTNQQLQAKCDQLTKQVLLEQGTAKNLQTEGRSREDGLREQLATAERAMHGLTAKVAELEGKLSVKPKTVTETKVVQSKGKPRAIPEFVVENIIRGPNDRIVSASIKPRV